MTGCLRVGFCFLEWWWWWCRVHYLNRWSYVHLGVPFDGTLFLAPVAFVVFGVGEEIILKYGHYDVSLSTYGICFIVVQIVNKISTVEGIQSSKR